MLSELTRIIFLSINHIDIVSIIIRTSSNYLIFFLLYLILSTKVRVSAGDMKLFSLLLSFQGRERGLVIIFISLVISIFPLLKGVKKVPLALMSLFGLVTFLLINKGF